MKTPKFNNKKTVIDGKTFDSKKEATRYTHLKLLQQVGQIEDLKTQVKYDMVVNGVKVCAYYADFEYVEKMQIVVEDVKSEVTRKLPVYRLKKKLMLALHGIDIKEI